jgi:hypothetical protein
VTAEVVPALTAADLAAAPLAVLAGPPPGRVVAVVEDWLMLPLPVFRGLADRWAPSGRVRCPVRGCGVSIRARSWDAAGALLGDVEPVPALWGCSWHGPAGVRRQWPPAGPVGVCVGPVPALSE